MAISALTIISLNRAIGKPIRLTVMSDINLAMPCSNAIVYYISQILSHSIPILRFNPFL